MGFADRRWRSGRPWALVALGLCCRSAMAQTPDDLAARMEAARSSLPSVGGSLRIQSEYIGIPHRPPSTSSQKSQAIDGDYRWWVKGSGWQIVKRTPSDPQFTQTKERILVRKDFEKGYLDYEMFLNKKDELVVGYAKWYEQNSFDNFINPLYGRFTSSGYPEKVLPALQDLVIGHGPNGMIHVSGYKGAFRQRVEMVVDPERSYMIMSFRVMYRSFRTGYTIQEVEKVGGHWFASRVVVEGGNYEAGRLAQGTKMLVTVEHLETSQGPTASEVPALPAGTLVGGDTRLFRVRHDGSLQYWGQLGRRRPSAPIAWGLVFVLSGAVLLVASLSWLVLKQRDRKAPAV